MEQDIKKLSQEERVERAQAYYARVLSGKERIEVPQTKTCKVVIVVPVHDEELTRITRQVESIKNQTVGKDVYEVIYVVNSDRLGADERSQRIAARNKAVLEYGASSTGMPVHAIDATSPGNEIGGCTVGKARNRGVAEASERFYSRGVNGIIVQTDADTWFEDTQYLEKVLSMFESNPSLIGVAGGLIFEYSPDTHEKEDVGLQEKLKIFVLLKKWKYITKILNGEALESAFTNDSFSGANMVSRSFESAVVGGVPELASGEDPAFGARLTAYAALHDGVVEGRKKELKVVTALRGSDRTPASFKAQLDAISLGEVIQVEVPREFVAEYGETTQLTPELVEYFWKLIKAKQEHRAIVEALEEVVENIRIT